jgi:hypothetical protein
MNVKHLVAAFTVFAATDSVFAQDFGAPDANFVSTRTRADVIAEIAQARAEGTLDARDTNYPFIAKSTSQKTRAEVVTEIARARANVTLEVTEGAYPFLSVTASSKTRDEVRAELAQYKTLHPYNMGDSACDGV